jgi:uncharacterized membrane protein
MNTPYFYYDMKPVTIRTIEITGYLGLAFMWIWLGITYRDLPDQVPIHFDHRGRPDGYGHKMITCILPLLATILFVILNKTAKNRLAGKLQATGVVVALAVLLVKSIQVAQGTAESLGAYFLPLAIGLVFVPGIASAFNAGKK